MPNIKHPKFDPIISEETRKARKHFSYEAIQKAKGAAPTAPPRFWLNPTVIPFIKPMRLNQDGRGTCTAYCNTYLQLMRHLLTVTADQPTAADFATIARNQLVTVGSCVMKFDKLPRMVPSMEWNYVQGRKLIPPPTPPAGGYVDLCLQAWQKVGWCPENYCQTAMQPNCVPWEYNTLGLTDAQITTEAARHKLDGGYATVDDLDTMASAMYNAFLTKTGGFACMGINIMTNFQTGSVRTLGGYKVYIFPNGAINDGGHAQAIAGFDLDNRIYITLSSWETDDAVWLFLNGFTESYVQQNGTVIYVPIDSDDVAIGQQIYNVVNFTCNVPASVAVNGNTYTMPNQVTLLDGQYTFVATPTNPDTVVEPSISKFINLTNDTTVVFTFTTKQTPPPVAKIEATPQAGHVPLTVQFYDRSDGTVDARAWAFGDGGTSTMIAPQHIYQAAGTYTAELYVSNTGGASTAIAAISVSAPPNPPNPPTPTPWERFIAWLISIFSHLFGG